MKEQTIKKFKITGNTDTINTANFYLKSLQNQDLNDSILNIASSFEESLIKYLIKNKTAKCICIMHTNYDGLLNFFGTTSYFFTTEEKQDALKEATKLGEKLVEYDFTKIIEMGDNEFERAAEPFKNKESYKQIQILRTLLRNKP